MDLIILSWFHSFIGLEVSGRWLPENQNQYYYYSKNQNSVQSDTYSGWYAQ